MSTNSQTSKWAIPDRLNLAITALQVSLSVGLLAAASLAWQADSLVGTALAALLFSFIMQTGFSLLHEAEHRKLNSDRQINDAMGFVCAAMFPASFQLMTVAHLNHHKVNRSDAELVDYIKPGEPVMAKCLQYYALVSGLVWITAPLMTLFICLVPNAWLQKALSDEDDSTLGRYLGFVQRCDASKVRQETLVAALLWVITWLALDLSWQAVAISYGAFAFSWSSQQYIYHVRTPRHLIEGAFDLKLWWPMQWLYLNFNYHLSHHRAPNVSWLHMPKVAVVEPDQPYLLTYLKMWRPPQPVTRAWPIEHQIRGPLIPKSGR